MVDILFILCFMKDQVPRLLSSAACHYEVEWLTEYACPVDNLVSRSCQLNLGQHGIHVDLSPLSSGLFKEITVLLCQSHVEFK